MKNLTFPLIFPPLQNETPLLEKVARQEVQQSERWEAFSWGGKEDKRVYNSCYSNRLDSLHSPHNDQLLVIASEAKQSSFSPSSLRTQWSNPSTKQLCLPMDCFGRFTPSQRRTKWSNPVTNLPAYGLPRLIAFASQWLTTRHCERSEAIQLLILPAYGLPRLIAFASQWLTTRHCERSEAIQLLNKSTYKVDCHGSFHSPRNDK